MKFTGEEMLGTIVAGFPGASDVFKNYRIDFCCGGNRKLNAVLAEMKLDSSAVIAKLNQEYMEFTRKQETHVATDWRQAPLAELVDHIVDTHHTYLHRELPKIGELVLKILRVHGGKHTTLNRVHKLFNAIKTELESHLIKEEELLYPLIKEYIVQPTDTIRNRIYQIIEEIESEHTGAGDILKELRSITNDFTPPADGCATYALTYSKFEELENDIFQHIHLENNILHPRIGYTAK